MDPMRAIRRTWAALLGAVVLGFGYLFFVPPVSSRATDTLVAWGMVAVGSVLGLVVEARIVALVRASRPEALATEDDRAGSEAFVRG